MDYVFVNPVAGAGKGKELAKQFSHAQIIETTGSDDEKKVQEMLKNEPDKIIGIGGDGTVHLLAQHLVGKKIPLQIVPAGSTNSIYYELQKYRPTAIDVLSVNDVFAIHLAGFGLNARIIKQADNEDTGAWKYLKQLFSSIKNTKNAKFLIDGNEYTTPVLVLANGRAFRKTIRINPKGRYDDGKCELCTPGFQRQFSEIEIQNPDKEAFQVDGEFMGHPEKVMAKCVPKALLITYSDT